MRSRIRAGVWKQGPWCRARGPPVASWDAPEILHIQVHHLPRPCREDVLPEPAQRLVGSGKTPESRDPQPEHAPAYATQVPLMTLATHVDLDGPC